MKDLVSDLPAAANKRERNGDHGKRPEESPTKVPFPKKHRRRHQRNNQVQGQRRRLHHRGFEARQGHHRQVTGRAVFPDFEYLSLEDIDIRAEAQEDPRGFLERRKKCFILDEVQHAPQLFSYLQGYADRQKEPGRIVLTGSQNFRLMESITQSLAGRVGLIELLPFSWEELRHSSRAGRDLDAVLFTGAYPPVHDRDLAPEDWYPRYIQTYIDRDVRTLRNIGDLVSFQKFVRLCAGRIGQLLNQSGLANECGIDTKTAQAWLSVLEASYLVIRLQPHSRNFNKRLVKQPKLYFTDTGLACALLRIETSNQLETHFLRGGLFENWVILEFLKKRYNEGKRSNLFFWRDHLGREIDLIREEADRLHAVEIKSGATVNDSFFSNLSWYQKTAGKTLASSTLIYGGTRASRRMDTDVLPWQQLA